MRQNIEMKEADYYRTYLLGHLRDHFFPQATDSKFIDTRVNEAYDRFTALRLDRPVLRCESSHVLIGFIIIYKFYLLLLIQDL